MPKGVMVTHGNLLHNLASAFHLAETDSSTVSVSWLPVVHDMGLIERISDRISVLNFGKKIAEGVGGRRLRAGGRAADRLLTHRGKKQLIN